LYEKLKGKEKKELPSQNREKKVLPGKREGGKLQLSYKRRREGKGANSTATGKEGGERTSLSAASRKKIKKKKKNRVPTSRTQKKRRGLEL